MKKVSPTVILLLVSFIITACMSSAEAHQGRSTLQFEDYDFPEYNQNQANQNGIVLGLSGIYAIDSRTVFLFGNLEIANMLGVHRSLLLRSIDGGQHWQEVNIKPEYNCSFIIVAFVSDGVGWAISAVDVEDFSARNLYRSDDFGKTWSDPIQIGGWGFHPWGMKFTDENNGYIKFDWANGSLNDHFGILTTKDGGLTWKETFSKPIIYEKDFAKYQQVFEQAHAELAEPTGGSFGSYWGNYWDTEKDRNTDNTEGHDGSEWNLYYYKPSAEYILLWRAKRDNSWAAVSTIATHYNYNNGRITDP
jgi:photosystem II stability/assembly factor-like uncharacterized protein